MTGKPSEDAIRAALSEMDGMLVYKPSDRDVNWKPCDYMLWWGEPTTDDGVLRFVPAVRAAWLEVKQTTLKGKWSWVQGEGALRPSQAAGMRHAFAISLPYIVAVYWKTRRYWTLHQLTPSFPLVITFEQATVEHGVGSAPANLAVTLRGVLNGEAGL